MSQAEQRKVEPSQLEIDINTTYYAHDIKSRIFRHLGLLFAFGQLLLGSAIMTKIFNPTFLGFCIAFIGALQATIKPASEEAASRVFKLEMNELADEIHGSGENSEVFWAVYSAFNTASKKEPDISNTVLMIAQQCAHIKLGIKQRVHLNIWQKALAVFAGVTQIFTHN